ncbi:MFS general substrate transporter [Penicillium argentinense]|uniref:MFS general substrate transporter n=1 Tax=Penicillium argentinense TaxID=1131581 RepID=A0A9W9EZN3_9EURO|nr:MFS general substrate transporter [Penicillium argentinense]KAJ5090834.1 MFS general substrate transporter [Penicillium argentinense]
MASIELYQPRNNHDRRIFEAETPDPERNYTQAPDAAAFDEIPPNGGYGWVCTLCSFLIIVHTWGINAAWGVILAYFLSHSTFPGASRIEYALIGGLSIAQAMLMGPIVSECRRKLGTTVTLLIGTIFVFASLMAASYSQQIWHLFLSQGICFGIGMGFLYLTAMHVLPTWFSTRRSFAVGIAGAGSGIGGIVYSLAAGHAIEVQGVRATYRILAYCALAANLPASLLLKSHEAPHHDRSRRSVDYKDLAKPEVLLVILWGITTDLGYIALIYSLPNYASSIGLTAQQGSVTGAMLNLGLTIGRPVTGYLSDTLGRITVPMVLTAICGLLCFIVWIPAQTYDVLLLFALTAGMVCGTFWGTVVPVLAEVVGMGRMASVFTVICLALVGPTTVAEPIALSLVSGGSKYLHTQVYVGCLFLVGSFGAWMLRSWKCYEVEKKASDEHEGLTSDTSSFPTFFRWITPQKLFIQGRV